MDERRSYLAESRDRMRIENPGLCAREQIRGENRCGVQRLALARECAAKLIGDHDTVTAARLDRFAEALLVLADAQFGEAATEFFAAAGALTEEIRSSAASPEPPGTR